MGGDRGGRVREDRGRKMEEVEREREKTKGEDTGRKM